MIRQGNDVQLNPRDIVVGDLVRLTYVLLCRSLHCSYLSLQRFVSVFSLKYTSQKKSHYLLSQKIFFLKKIEKMTRRTSHRYGATVPADGYIVESNDIKIDESALTGEPVLMSKDPNSKHGEKFFLMSGTQVQIGGGKMIVCAVGENSVKGRIQKSIAEEEKKKQAAQEDKDEEDGGDEVGEGRGMGEKLDLLAHQIGMLGGVVAVICFVGMTIFWAIDLSSGTCKDTSGVEIRWSSTTPALHEP